VITKKNNEFLSTTTDDLFLTGKTKVKHH